MTIKKRTHWTFNTFHKFWHFICYSFRLVFLLTYFHSTKSFTSFIRFTRFTLGKTCKTQIPRVIKMPYLLTKFSDSIQTFKIYGYFYCSAKHLFLLCRKISQKIQLQIFILICFRLNNAYVLLTLHSLIVEALFYWKNYFK